MSTALAKVKSGRLFDRNLGCDTVRVLPGDYFVTDEEIGIITVLGSCVAACLWDEGSGLGGMNHFMLADGGANDESGGAPARYGLYAMEVLINDLLKRGARRSKMKAKLFGGGAVIRGMTTMNVGDRNAAFALEFLRTEKIPLVGQDLREAYARKVAFMPKSGRAMVKRIDPNADSSVVELERKYVTTLAKKPVGGDIELF
ncbi:MAG: chemoreceptor glutamine deamidase CheD [Burkholderiales bacterium]